MSSEQSAPVFSVEQQHQLEQFYYREARMLDNRQFKQWLTLLDPGVRYQVPSRFNVQINNRDRENEEMLAIERELEGVESMGNPLRDENIIHLTLRAERAYKINAWAEQPPARTRRMVSNVEVLSNEGDGLRVLSNFFLYFSRPDVETVIYSGQRRDRLAVAGEGGYCIVQREVVLDYARIEAPTMGLIF